MTNYSHTQYGLIHWLCFLVGMVFCGLTLVLLPNPVVHQTFWLSGLVCLLLGLCIRSLTVTDCGDQLQIAFGPLPFIRRTISYADIADAVVTKTTLLDGFGANYMPGRGWTYNIHGWDCVELRLTNGKSVRVGSDDSDALAEVVKDRIQRSGTANESSGSD